MTRITVREYARLTTSEVVVPTLDRAQVSTKAFDWLCDLSARFSRAGAPLVQIEDRRWLRLDNFVGVLETPCGTHLEILPKHVTQEGNAFTASRQLLRRMIAASMDLPKRATGPADLELFDAPLSEWVMGQFLDSLDHLLKRGLRSEYVRIESAERYLRGRLETVQQMRQPPGQQHIFHISHDRFLPDRPENRLLKSALDMVCRLTQLPQQWQLAQELRNLMQEIPGSSNVASDFGSWRNERLMAHYQPVRPWCELILYRQMPVAVSGDWHGISMLFPMEKLFERYVAAALKRGLHHDARLVTQASSQYLCQHIGKPIFLLQPDILLEDGQERWILDTKWKLLHSMSRENKYDLDQSDFYQLYAYGRKYLRGKGNIVLIYPRHANFQEPLPPFEFDADLRLYVLPFDLDDGVLIGAQLSGLPLKLNEFQHSLAPAKYANFA